jgi:succinate dehydrogenase / fumarate reductase, iron-sulfur subunit
MQVFFKVVRQSLNTAPQIQSYSLEVNSGDTLLDCLNRIKWEQDGSLAFRKNCRNTICGSCGMRMNGRSVLACKENVAQELERLKQIPVQMSSAGANSTANTLPEITVAPMGNMPVIKDLVVDMQSFWTNLEVVDPYISTSARRVPEREFLQSPEERARLDQTGNCILCGACYSDCNAREVSSEFVGPHALAKAYRTLADTRDDATTARLEKYNLGLQGVWGCTRCFNCNTVCPMGVAPLDQINRIKNDILAHPVQPTTRSIRHRRVLIDLVKRGGWIDERRFGLRVVGNEFRDLRGLFSLAPLGVRMLARRKFPLRFEASTGTPRVRSLIEAVNTVKSNSKLPLTSEAMATTDPQPENLATPPEPAFGWTPYAEVINGRFAMVGFAALLILEWFTRQDFFTWLGLR